MFLGRRSGKPSRPVLLLHQPTQGRPCGTARGDPSPLLPRPLFQCESIISSLQRESVFQNVITVFKELQPLGPDDTGGQFLMTQVECDLDPPAALQAPGLVFTTRWPAATASSRSIRSRPTTRSPPPHLCRPEHRGPPAQVVHPLPNTALVTCGRNTGVLSPLERPNRYLNLALRIDIEHSTLPPLEYYCEYNGDRTTSTSCSSRP